MADSPGGSTLDTLSATLEEWFDALENDQERNDAQRDAVNDAVSPTTDTAALYELLQHLFKRQKITEALWNEFQRFKPQENPEAKLQAANEIFAREWAEFTAKADNKDWAAVASKLIASLKDLASHAELAPQIKASLTQAITAVLKFRIDVQGANPTQLPLPKEVFEVFKVFDHIKLADIRTIGTGLKPKGLSQSTLPTATTSQPTTPVQPVAHSVLGVAAYDAKLSPAAATSPSPPTEQTTPTLPAGTSSTPSPAAVGDGVSPTTRPRVVHEPPAEFKTATATDFLVLGGEAPPVARELQHELGKLPQTLYPTLNDPSPAGRPPEAAQAAQLAQPPPEFPPVEKAPLAAPQQPAAESQAPSAKKPGPSSDVPAQGAAAQAAVSDPMDVETPQVAFQSLPGDTVRIYFQVIVTYPISSGVELSIVGVHPQLGGDHYSHRKILRRVPTGPDGAASNLFCGTFELSRKWVQSPEVWTKYNYYLTEHTLISSLSGGVFNPLINIDGTNRQLWTNYLGQTAMLIPDQIDSPNYHTGAPPQFLDSLGRSNLIAATIYLYFIDPDRRPLATFGQLLNMFMYFIAPCTVQDASNIVGALLQQLKGAQISISERATITLAVMVAVQNRYLASPSQNSPLHHHIVPDGKLMLNFSSTLMSEFFSAIPQVQWLSLLSGVYQQNFQALQATLGFVISTMLTKGRLGCFYLAAVLNGIAAANAQFEMNSYHSFIDNVATQRITNFTINQDELVQVIQRISQLRLDSHPDMISRDRGFPVLPLLAAASNSVRALYALLATVDPKTIGADLARQLFQTCHLVASYGWKALYPCITKILQLPNLPVPDIVKLVTSALQHERTAVPAEQDEIVTQACGVVQAHAIADFAARQSLMTQTVMLPVFGTVARSVQFAQACWHDVTAVDTETLSSFLTLLKARSTNSNERMLGLLRGYTALRGLKAFANSTTLVDSLNQELRQVNDETLLSFLPSPNLDWSNIHPHMQQCFEERLIRTVRDVDKDSALALIDTLRAAFLATPAREGLCVKLLREARSVVFPPRVKQLAQAGAPEARAAQDVTNVYSIVEYEAVYVKLFELVDSIRAKVVNSSSIQEIIDELNFAQQCIKAAHEAISRATIFIKDALQLNVEQTRTKIVNLCKALKLGDTSAKLKELHQRAQAMRETITNYQTLCSLFSSFSNAGDYEDKKLIAASLESTAETTCLAELDEAIHNSLNSKSLTVLPRVQSLSKSKLFRRFLTLCSPYPTPSEFLLAVIAFSGSTNPPSPTLPATATAAKAESPRSDDDDDMLGYDSDDPKSSETPSNSDEEVEDVPVMGRTSLNVNSTHDTAFRFYEKNFDGVVTEMCKYWEVIHSGLANSSLPLGIVFALFDPIHPEQWLPELKLLSATTRAPVGPVGPSADQLHQNLTPLEFVYAFNAINGLQQVISILGLDAALEKDELWGTFCTRATEFSGWKNLSLATASKMKASFAHIQKLSRPVQEMFTSLAKGAELLKYLISLHKQDADKTSVDKLFHLCFMNTDVDTDRALISSLRIVWSQLHPLVSLSSKTSLTFGALMTAIASIKSGPSDELIRAIEAVVDDVLRVRQVIERAQLDTTTNAIRDLERLQQSGQFILQNPSDKTNDTLTAILEIKVLAKPNTASAAAGFRAILAAAKAKGTEQKVMSIAELEDLRSSLMLAADYKDKAESIDTFLDNFGHLLDINKLMVQLFTDGHCDFQEYRRDYVINRLVSAELAAEKDRLEAESSAWRAKLLQIRLSNYFCNFFTIKQLLAIASALNAVDVDTLQPWLRLIDPEVTSAQVEHLCSLPVSQSDANGTHLQDLGRHLSSIFSQGGSKVRHTTEPYAKHPGEFRDGQLNSVSASNLEDTLCTCLSLYAAFGHFPSPEELLVASKETTEEEVVLFFLRCLGAAKSRRLDNLYVLLHAEKLSIEMQEKLALTLHHFIKAYYPDNNQFRLVILCNNQERTSEFPLVRGHASINVSLLPNHTLQEMLNELFAVKKMTVTNFTSDMAGAGKSHEIRTLCAQSAQNPVTVAINRQLTIDELVDAFVKARQRSIESSDVGEPATAWILAVGHLVTPHFNLQLFQLLVLGYLQTSAGTIFWPPESGVSYYIELPNSVVDLKLFFPKLLPKTVELFIANQQLDVSLNDPQFVESYVSEGLSVRQNRVQYVCKFLNHLSSQQTGTRTFHPHEEADLPTDHCVRLIDEFCKHSTGSSRQGRVTPNTLILRKNFVDYLFRQLRIFEQSTFFKVEYHDRPSIQQLMMPMIRFFLERIIDTARDYSSAYMETAKQSSVNNALELQYQLVRRWKPAEYPLIVFNQDLSGSITTLWPEIKPEHRDLWKKVTNEEPKPLLQMTQAEAIAKLAITFGKDEKEIEAATRQSKDSTSYYVLTRDNTMKLISIFFRIESGIPVIVMGETGCGKTRLVEFLAAIHQIGETLPLIKRDVHGGTSEADILSDVEAAKEKLIEIEIKIRSEIELTKDRLGRLPTSNVAEIDAANRKLVKLEAQKENIKCYLFFDEINTCNNLGLFKEIICDRRVNGVELNHRIVVLAACNPYKRKTVTQGAGNAPGLAYSYGQKASDRQHWTENIQDLVYAVHPLPETMKQLVWDFGSLSSEDEAHYITRIVENSGVIAPDKSVTFAQGAAHNRHEANATVAELQKTFVDCIKASQSFMRDRIYRDSPDDPSGMVSLRDVIRTVQLFRWFLQNLRGRNQKATVDAFGKQTSDVISSSEYTKLVHKSIALALSFNYFFRLTNDQRETYSDQMDKILRPRRHDPFFPKCITEEERFWMDEMKIPDNTSKNQALLENVFVLIVCIYNAIPVFIVGKPGASKTLAMSVVKDTFAQSRLNLPPMQVISHQCSPQTTTAELLKTFEIAQNLQNSTGASQRVVVLLDEVGLAEYSPDLPLKMLHRQMENNDFATGRSNQGRELSIVGISNWRLDPAKMNRAILVHRPNPTIVDLTETAKAIGADSSNSLHANQLNQLATAYNTIYTTQDPKDFWGLRDFYHLIKYLNRELMGGVLSSEMLKSAVAHNFSGKPPAADATNPLENQNVSKFVSEVMKKAQHKNSVSTTDMQTVNTLELVRDNLKLPGMRHLMIITDEHDSALQILLDQRVLNQAKTTFLFRSDYNDDSGDLYTLRAIQTIRTCMEKGETVVLLHQNNLYESLYDLLNQNYTSIGKSKFCYLALAGNSKQCIVHPEFKCIVVVSRNEQLPIALMNRFEKQYLDRPVALHATLKSQGIYAEIVAMRKGLQDYVHKFCTPDKQYETILPARRPEEVFLGYSDSLIDSLILSYITEHNDYSANKFTSHMRQDCVRRLLRIAKPEAIVRLKYMRLDGTEKVLDFYFTKQVHSHLPALIESTVGDSKKGVQAVALTTCLFPLNVEAVIEHHIPDAKGAVQVIALANLHSENALLRQLQSFWNPSSDKRYLVVLHDANRNLQQRFTQFKFHCSKFRGEYLARHFKGKGAAAASGAQAPFVPKHVYIVVHIPKSKVTASPATKGSAPTSYSGAAAAAPKPTSTSAFSSPATTSVSASTGRNPLPFTFDAERDWIYNSLDAIDPGQTAGMPEMAEMLATETLKDAIELNSLKSFLPNVIKNEYRSCLPKLSYPREMTATSEEARKFYITQVDILSYLLGDKPKFLEGLTNALAELMNSYSKTFQPQSKEQSQPASAAGAKASTKSAAGSASTLPWYVHAANNQALIEGEGSFRGALYQGILKPLRFTLTLMLSILDQNLNLRTLHSGSDSAQQLWLAILADQSLWMPMIRSAFSPAVAQRLQQAADSTLEVPWAARTKAFNCSFPFSHIISSTLDALRDPCLRSLTTDAPFEDGNPMFLKLISLVGNAAPGMKLIAIENNPDFANDEEEGQDAPMGARYIQDFVLLHPISTSNIPQEAVAELTLTILSLYILNDMRAQLTPISAHAAYWTLEPTLLALWGMLDSIPNNSGLMSDVKRVIKNERDSLDSLLAAIAALIQEQALNPDNFTDLASWLEAFSSLQAYFVILFESNAEANKKWKVLTLFKQFIAMVHQPLKLGKPIATQYLAQLNGFYERGQSFQTLAFLNQQLEFLTQRIPAPESDRDKETHWAAVSRFAEFFITNVCLARPSPSARAASASGTAAAAPASNARDFDAPLIDFILRALVDEANSENLLALRKAKAQVLAPHLFLHLSFASRASILHKLLDLFGDNIREWLESPFHRFLAARFAETVGLDVQELPGCLDTPFGVVYTEALQAWLVEKLDSEHDQAFKHTKSRLSRSASDLTKSVKPPSPSPTRIARVSRSPSIEAMLNRLLGAVTGGSFWNLARESPLSVLEFSAGGKTIMALYATNLVRRAEIQLLQGKQGNTDVDEHLKTIQSTLQTLDQLANSVFTATARQAGAATVDTINPFHLYLMRILSSQVGLQQAQALVFPAGRPAAPWLSSLRFPALAGDRPANMPFIDPSTILLTNEYLEMKKAMFAAVNHGELTALQALLTANSLPATRMRQVFFMAFSQEIVSAYCKGGTISAALEAFLGERRNIAFYQPHEHVWILKLAKNRLVLRNKGSLSPETPAGDVSKLLVQLHLLAALMTHPEGVTPFLQLIKEPSACKDNVLPTMPDDPRIAQALLAWAANEGPYLSPQGHFYSVGNCTWPMVTFTCPCGKEQVGGSSHVPLPGNVRILRGDGSAGDANYARQAAGYQRGTITLAELNNAPPGYAPEANDNANYTVRGMNALVLRVIRLFVNSALALASSFAADNNALAQVLSVAPGLLENQKSSNYFWTQLDQDWQFLETQLLNINREDLAIGLHFIIDVLGKTNATSAPNSAKLATGAMRNQFEAWLAGQVVGPALANLTTDIARIKTTCAAQSTQEVANFQAEIEEVLPDAKVQLDITFRQLNTPALFRFKVPRSREALSAALSINTELSKKHAALALVLANASLIECLQYLPDLLNFQRFTHNYYNNRITLEEAQSTKIGDLLDKMASDSDRQHWKAVFDKFRRGWNKAAPLVERAFVAADNAITFDRLTTDSPLSQILNAVPHGRAMKEIIGFLIKQHNALLISLHKIRHPTRHAAWEAAVALIPETDPVDQAIKLLATMSHRQLVPYGMLHPRHSLVPFELTAASGLVLGRVAADYPLYGMGSKLEFDFDYLENFVVDHLLSDKPFILFSDLQGFGYAGELELGKTKKRIKASIAQKKLPKDLETQILADLNSSQLLLHMLRKVDLVMGWLKVTGGDAEMNLSEYANNVPKETGLDRLSLKDVRLKHILHLHSTIQRVLQSSVDNIVARAYTTPLATGSKPNLDYMAYLKKLNTAQMAELAEHLEAFIREYLTDGAVFPSTGSFAGYLAPLEPFFTDPVFPPSVTLASALDCFKIVKGKLASK